VKNLSKSIAGQLIINNISFIIVKGKITAIIGPNGAGKTTLMKLIMGTINPDSGSILVLNDVIEKSSIREQVGYIPEHLEFPPRSTPKHFLRHLCILNSFTFQQAQNHIYQIAKNLEFGSLLNKGFSTLSAGMRQKIRLAVGFMHHDLQFLLVDEPTTNLDILAREIFLNFLQQNVRENGLTVFYSSHVFPEVKRIADYLFILHEGSVVGQYDFCESILKHKTRNYRLRVDNIHLAVRVLEANGFSVSLIHNDSLLLKLQSQQKSNDSIDLLRKHDIQIHSFTEDPHVEAFSQLLKIQQTTSEKLILEN